MTSILPILLNSATDYMLPCLTKKYIGIDCPGCGMQRAIHLLVHGEFSAAFFMYPAIYPILALLGALIAKTLFKIKHGNTIILILGMLTAATILINYIIKLLH